MTRILLLNKPFGVICQFYARRRPPDAEGLVPVPRVYAAGRLDTDSEGLVMLTDDGALQAAIADPRHKLEKEYWVQVEGVPGEDALRALASGVPLPDGATLPARAELDARGARALAARAADSPSRLDSGRVAATRPARGAQPPGAAHDGGGGPSNAAARALARGTVEPRRHREREHGAKRNRSVRTICVAWRACNRAEYGRIVAIF